MLYTSGYSENAVIHNNRLDPDILLLTKPYRRSELARMIRLALNSGTSPAGAPRRRRRAARSDTQPRITPSLGFGRSLPEGHPLIGATARRTALFSCSAAASESVPERAPPMRLDVGLRFAGTA